MEEQNILTSLTQKLELLQNKPNVVGEDSLKENDEQSKDNNQNIVNSCDTKVDVNVKSNKESLEEQKKFDKVATTLFESDESADYTEPESAESSSSESHESHESSIIAAEVKAKTNENITSNKSFQSSR